MKMLPYKWLRAVFGLTIGAVGLAALAFAFAVWLGTGLDKQPFDAGTIAFLVVLSVVGVSLLLAGRRLVKRAIKRSEK